ncbi:MaoC family dehydratase [Nocardioides sp. AN3]
MHTFHNLAELQAAEGTTLGTSSWLRIDQARINDFAEATGDFQWIHVDTERARAGQFGTTIAHGYLTLSLVPLLGSETYAFDGWPTVVNYGLDRVRFLNPVRCDSHIRATVDLVTVTPVDAGVQAKLRYTVEIQGETRPACVAETIVLLAS